MVLSYQTHLLVRYFLSVENISATKVCDTHSVGMYSHGTNGSHCLSQAPTTRRRRRESVPQYKSSSTYSHKTVRSGSGRPGRLCCLSLATLRFFFSLACITTKSRRFSPVVARSHMNVPRAHKKRIYYTTRYTIKVLRCVRDFFVGCPLSRSPNSQSCTPPSPTLVLQSTLSCTADRLPETVGEPVLLSFVCGLCAWVQNKMMRITGKRAARGQLR